MEDLCKPSEVERNVVHVHQIRVGPSWIDPIVLFLKNDVLPESKSEADKIQSKTPWFWLSENQKLYKRSFSGLYLLCVHPEAVKLLQKNYMKGFVEVTQEADLCLTRPSLKAIGGQICRGKYKSM